MGLGFLIRGSGFPYCGYSLMGGTHFGSRLFWVTFYHEGHEGVGLLGFTGQEVRAGKIWMMNVGIDTDGTDQVLCGKFLRGDYYDSDGSN